MRVILDTNVLISALLAPDGTAGSIYHHWLNGMFILLISDDQLKELRNTLRKPALRKRIRQHQAGRLVNSLRLLARETGPLPQVNRSPDPEDNCLLAMAEVGQADYLVAGDKSGLLAFLKHAGARIVTTREFANML